MRKLYFFCFLMYTVTCLSQKITLKILDFDTNAPIEKAHVFFIDKTKYSDENGAFSFNLKNKETISFSVTHLNYETKQVVFKKGITLLTIFLNEKQETLAGIEIYTKRN